MASVLETEGRQHQVIDGNGQRILMFPNEINSARNANVECNFIFSNSEFHAISVQLQKPIHAAISF